MTILRLSDPIIFSIAKLCYAKIVYKIDSKFAFTLTFFKVGSQTLQTDRAFGVRSRNRMSIKMLLRIFFTVFGRFRKPPPVCDLLIFQLILWCLSPKPITIRACWGGHNKI